jgi:hypothetical protein
MFGVGDMTHPSRYLSFFAEYYPWSYIIDSEETSDDGVWAAGTRLGNEKFGITLSAVGDPDYDDDWLFRLDFSVKKSTWILEYDHTQEEPSLYLGVGLHF